MVECCSNSKFTSDTTGTQHGRRTATPPLVSFLLYIIIIYRRHCRRRGGEHYDVVFLVFFHSERQVYIIVYVGEQSQTSSRPKTNINCSGEMCIRNNSGKKRS